MYIAAINKNTLNTPTPDTNRLSVTFTPNYWDFYIVTLGMIRYQRAMIIVHLLFPLAGLILLITSWLKGFPRGVTQTMLVSLVAILFTPVVLALTVFLFLRRNKLIQGSLTYSFDAEGVHTSGSVFNQTIKWPAILRVRQSKRFLFIFIGPARALFIPVQALRDQNLLEPVRDIIRQHADLR